MMGETLKYLRVFNDYTMTQLAEKLDMSQSYISELENGKKQPTLQILDKYSECFNIKPSTILLLSESLDHDKNANTSNMQQRVAYIAMKFLKIIERAGALEDE